MTGSSTTEVGQGWPEMVSVSALPNPARGKVALVIRGPEATELRGTIEDLRGRAVYRFSAATGMDRGTWAFHWNGCDARGAQVPAGIYFVKVYAGGHVNRTKLVMF